MMKRLLLVIMIIVLAASTACSSALSLGDKTSDDAHAFLIHSVQIIDEIEREVAPEGDTYLVIKYEIENLQNQNDSPRHWTDQITVESTNQQYTPTLIKSLDNQLWETSLLTKQKKSGYIVFIVPEGIDDFELTFTFPTSITEVTYNFRPVDKRASINVDYILTMLGKIERSRRIPLIGGPLAAFASAPIRHMGVILVPEEEISQLLEQIKDLNEDAKRQVIEDYLIARGHCRLE